LTIAAAGAALTGPKVQAAPLFFDCHSRSTGDLLMKSALDLSNEQLACVQTAAAVPISYQPVVTQPVVVLPAPAAGPSAGETLVGSVFGGRGTYPGSACARTEGRAVSTLRIREPRCTGWATTV
jgi:hypothetical protein